LEIVVAAVGVLEGMVAVVLGIFAVEPMAALGIVVAKVVEVVNFV
jgi:hypothetical protein